MPGKILNMNALAFCFAMAMTAFAGMATAQEDPPIDCANAQTQADMNSCSALDFEKADKELNAVYKQAMKNSVEADKQAAEMGPDYVGAVAELKKAQRAWIDYRDGHCDAMSREALGGSMQPMLINGCAARMTEARTKELRELIEALGGG